MSLISQLSEAVRGVNNQVGRCLFCGSECRLHHLADGDRVECLKCGYKSPVDVFALRKHNVLVESLLAAKEWAERKEEMNDIPPNPNVYHFDKGWEKAKIALQHAEIRLLAVWGRGVVGNVR